MTDIAAEKRVVGRAAAALVEDGMRVGLGTGTTVAQLIPALAERHLAITCVATSPATESAALRPRPRRWCPSTTWTGSTSRSTGPIRWTPSDGSSRGAGGRRPASASWPPPPIASWSSSRRTSWCRSSIPGSARAPRLRPGLDLAQAGVRGGAGCACAPLTRGVLADYGGVIDDPARLAARAERGARCGLAWLVRRRPWSARCSSPGARRWRSFQPGLTGIRGARRVVGSGHRGEGNRQEL